MAKIYGTHVCSKCGTEYSWDYQIPNRMSDRYFDVERIIPENVHAGRINSPSSDIIELSVRCKCCNQIDVFTYNTDSEQ